MTIKIDAFSIISKNMKDYEYYRDNNHYEDLVHELRFSQYNRSGLIADMVSIYYSRYLRDYVLSIVLDGDMIYMYYFNGKICTEPFVSFNSTKMRMVFKTSKKITDLAYFDHIRNFEYMLCDLPDDIYREINKFMNATNRYNFGMTCKQIKETIGALMRERNEHIYVYMRSKNGMKTAICHSFKNKDGEIEAYMLKDDKLQKQKRVYYVEYNIQQMKFHTNGSINYLLIGDDKIYMFNNAYKYYGDYTPKQPISKRIPKKIQYTSETPQYYYNANTGLFVIRDGDKIYYTDKAKFVGADKHSVKYNVGRGMENGHSNFRFYDINYTMANEYTLDILFDEITGTLIVFNDIYDKIDLFIVCKKMKKLS